MAKNKRVEQKIESILKINKICREVGANGTVLVERTLQVEGNNTKEVKEFFEKHW